MCYGRSLTTLLVVGVSALLAGCACSSGMCGDDARAGGGSVEREVFKLRPGVEDQYGYTHAIRIGDRLMISGAVSMDAEGHPTAAGDLGQQVRNCYADLRAILEHFGCTFADVVVENIFTTDMAGMLQQGGYRAEVYGGQYPTGTWVEVKGLALPEFMVEIEVEAHCPGR